MAEQEEDTTNESCWLNWCRLCGRKDNTQGKVKIYTNETENTENSVVEMAIRKFFDVHMQEKDEPYGVVCETCYTFMIKLIDFAEHVTKVQAIFKLLRNTPEKPEIYESPNTKDLPEITPKKDNINPLSVDEVSYPSCTAFNQTANKEISLSIEGNNVIIKSEEETQIEVTQYSISEAFNFLPIDEDMTNSSSTVESEKHPPNTPEIAPKEDNINPLSVDEVSYRSHKRNNPMSGEGKRLIGSTKRKLNTKSKIEKIKLRRDDDTECSQTITPSSITPNIKQKNSQDLASRDTTESGFDTLSSKSIEQKGTHDLSAKNTTESDLKALSSESGKKNTLTYRCDLCNKTLSNATALKMHKQVMHVKSTPFMCDDCGKQFKTKPALKEHKLVHTEERPYVCTTCNGAFKSQARLNRHLQIHSEPSYECEICGKKLQTRDTLLNHKNVHTKARRFKCTVCGTVTSSSTTLKHHLLSHAGIRSYSCKYCNKEFICATDVKKHKKKMHPVEYERDEDQSCRVANVPSLKELRALAVALGKREPLRKPKNK